MRAAALVLVLTVAVAAGCSSSPGGTNGTPTPTPSPTSTPTPGQPLGTRSFTVSQGADGSGAANSFYDSTALPGTDLSQFLGALGWTASGPLLLHAGVPDGAGKAALTLTSNVTVSISLPQSNCICRQFLAAGSTGSLYCSAHTDPVDFTASWDNSVPANPTVVTAGTTAAGAGDVRLTLQTLETSITLASGETCLLSACTTALSGATPTPLAYTTSTATSSVLHPAQGGTVSISIPGHPFGGCADWTSAVTKGALAGAGEHDNNGGSDIATVERVAEH